MIYLIWSLLNLGLVIYFLVICLKAIKLLRERVGVFAAVIFVFGLLSFLGQSAQDSYRKRTDSNDLKTWTFVSENSLEEHVVSFEEIELEANIISKRHLRVKYGNIAQSQYNIPISASPYTSGFCSGTDWIPVAINVYSINNNKEFKYSVIAVIEWKLMGLTLYNQQKKYDGIIDLS